MDDETRDALNVSTGFEMGFGIVLRYLLAERMATLPPSERERVAQDLIRKASDPAQFQDMAPTAELQMYLLDSADAMQRVVTSIVQGALADAQ